MPQGFEYVSLILQRLATEFSLMCHLGGATDPAGWRHRCAPLRFRHHCAAKSQPAQLTDLAPLARPSPSPPPFTPHSFSPSCPPLFPLPFLFSFLLQSELIPSSSPHTLHTSSSFPPPTLSVSEEKVVDPARGATKPTKRTLGGKTHPLEDSPTNPCNGSPIPTSIIMAFLLRVNSSHTLLNWIYIAHF